MYWDDYWQMYTDGSGNYYYSDMSYAGYEDPETGDWWPAGGYEGDSGNGGGNGDTGAGGGYPPYAGAPGVSEWLEEGESVQDYGNVGPRVIEEKAQTSSWWSKAWEIVKDIGGAALDTLGNIKVSGSGGSGPGGSGGSGPGGPYVTIPGVGTFGPQGRIPETADTGIAGYLPYIAVGGLAYLLFFRK